MHPFAKAEVAYLVRAGRRPAIRAIVTNFNSALTETVIPDESGRIVDIAPFNQESRSVWLMLAEDGGLHRFDARSGESQGFGSIEIPSEIPKEPFRERALRRHLYVSPNGRFAAVVNDYGRYGRVVDLQSRKVTMTLDGGDYCHETVPFAFAFASWQGEVVVIHRSAWNRLDVSDASSGRLLSQRAPTKYQHGEEKPPHHLDYFHGALYLSPSGKHILDDGWVWHPVGMPVVWSVDRWLSENVWESEDGASRRDICARDGYWDGGIAWLDETTVAIGGIGDDETEMVEGARIFDITSTASASRRWRSDWLWAREVMTFSGPEGRFFSDGKWLYSSAKSGFARWDLKTGARTGGIETFHPTYHHHAAGELVQLAEHTLLRWSTTAPS